MFILSLPLHPRLVHFPIALLLMGALAIIVYQWRPYPWLRGWGFLALLAGWVLTLPGIITGLIDKSSLTPASGANQLANLHTTAIFVMWAIYGLALYWSYLWRREMERSGRRWKLTALLVLASFILILAGDLGGRLVYDLGVGVRPPAP